MPSCNQNNQNMKNSEGGNESELYYYDLELSINYP